MDVLEILDEIHRLDVEIEERKRKISALTDELGKIVIEREKQIKTGGR